VTRRLRPEGTARRNAREDHPDAGIWDPKSDNTPARDHFFPNKRDQKPGGAGIRVTFIRHFGQTCDVLPATCCVRSCDSDNTAPHRGLVQQYIAPLPFFPSFNAVGGGPIGCGVGASAGFSTIRRGNFRAVGVTDAGTVT
jgi:hypothetical protein